MVQVNAIGRRMEGVGAPVRAFYAGNKKYFKARIAKIFPYEPSPSAPDSGDVNVADDTGKLVYHNSDTPLMCEV